MPQQFLVAFVLLEFTTKLIDKGITKYLRNEKKLSHQTTIVESNLTGYTNTNHGNYFDISDFQNCCFSFSSEVKFERQSCF